MENIIEVDRDFIEKIEPVPSPKILNGITQEDLKRVNDDILLSLNDLNRLFKESDELQNNIAPLIRQDATFENIIKNYVSNGDPTEYNKVADNIKNSTYNVTDKDKNSKIYSAFLNNDKIIITMDDIKALLNDAPESTTRNRVLQAIAKSEKLQKIIITYYSQKMGADFDKLLNDMQNSEIARKLKIVEVLKNLRQYNKMRENYELELAQRDRLEALANIKSRWNTIFEFLKSVNTKSNWIAGAGGIIGIIGIISTTIAAVQGKKAAEVKTVNMPNKHKSKIVHIK